MKIKLTEGTSFMVLDEKFLAVINDKDHYYFHLYEDGGHIIKTYRSSVEFATMIVNNYRDMGSILNKLRKIKIGDERIDVTELAANLCNVKTQNREVADEEKTEQEDSPNSNIEAFLKNENTQLLVAKLNNCETLDDMVEEIRNFELDNRNISYNKRVGYIDTEKSKIIILNSEFLIIENEDGRIYLHVDSYDGHILNITNCPAAFAVMLAKRLDYWKTPEEKYMLKETLNSFEKVKIIEDPSTIGGLDFASELKYYHSINLLAWVPPVDWEEWQIKQEWIKEMEEFLQVKRVQRLIKSLRECEDLKWMVKEIMKFKEC